MMPRERYALRGPQVLARMRKVIWIFGILPVFLGVSMPSAGARTTLAVLDLTDRGVGPELAQTLSDVMTGALSDMGVFKIISRADIVRILEFEVQKQTIGCSDDSSCLAEIGGALGAALLVSGSVGVVGDQYILNLTLVDTSGATVRAREQRQVENVSDLVTEVRAAVRFLVRGLLENRAGYLEVRASESEVDVELDGRLVGTTPLQRQTLGAGPHRVRLRKEGFIVWVRDVEVEQGDTTHITATLLPSAEFIGAHRRRAQTWRWTGYILSTVGAAAAAYGGWGYFFYNAKRAKTFNADVEAAGCAGPSPSLDCASEFGAQRQSIRRTDTIAQVSGSIGVAMLGAGLVALFLGPSPNAYAPDTAVLMPAPHGTALSLSWSY